MCNNLAMGPSRTGRLRFKIELWIRARLLPLQLRRVSLEKALERANPATLSTYSGLSVAYVVTRVQRTLRRPWLMRDQRCLRQGILGFRFLRAAGHDARLHFGVVESSLSAERIAAHCWVTVEGETVLGGQEADFVPIHIQSGSRTA